MGAQTPSTKPVANTGRPSRSHKRPHTALPDEDEDEVQAPTKKRKATAKASGKSSKKQDQAEKRPRRWRTHAPASYLERLERAMKQRMFVLSRHRHLPPTTSAPREELTMAGSTGNIYTVTISTIPTCTCPDHQKGNQCKHILYALARILKAPPHLRYQLSFLPAELASIFSASPLPDQGAGDLDSDASAGSRKPVAGDCPICFCGMDAEDPGDIVWCRAACGNNVHRECFVQWARSSRDAAGKVRCVYCRAEWEGPGGGPVAGAGWSGSAEELAALAAKTGVGEDGYANIAGELGISGVRDMGSYHQPWVRRMGGGGYYGRR